MFFTRFAEKSFRTSQSVQQIVIMKFFCKITPSGIEKYETSAEEEKIGRRMIVRM